MKGFFAKLADPFLYLFWRAQFSVLRAFPPLAGIVSSVSIGAANSRMAWIKALFRTAVRAPYALWLHWRNKRENRTVLPRANIVVTTRCTRNCDKCSAHIPDLKRHEDIPVRDLADDIRTLLSCVDHIYDAYLMGGEPFLHPDMDEIIRTCAESKKVGHISVPTNGTVFPAAKVLAALREAKATVKISKYPSAVQPDVERLKSILKENGVRYTHSSSTFWYDTGGGRPQEGSEKRRFSVCFQQLCFLYLHGKLSLCGEAGILMEEGVIPDCREDYIDLRSAGPSSFSEQLRKLMRKRTVSACSYCLGYTYKSPKFPVAVQRESR